MASRSNKAMRYAQPTMTSSVKTKPTPSVLGSVRGAVAAQRPRAVMAGGTDRNGNRSGARRVVGPADPATRRAALNAALKPGPAVKKPLPVKMGESLNGGFGGKQRSVAIDDQATRFQR